MTTSAMTAPTGRDAARTSSTLIGRSLKLKMLSSA
jgi:hypothetical protein